MEEEETEWAVGQGEDKGSVRIDKGFSSVSCVLSLMLCIPVSCYIPYICSKPLDRLVYVMYKMTVSPES